MIWRKWLVRGLVFSILGCLATLGLAYQAWTNPVATRRQVLDTLNSRFIGATVSLESARLRLLGGVAINDLRLTRKDDPEKKDFLFVPSGVIYHDKEHLLDGPVAIRKIELQRPRLHILRDKDGRLNLNGVIGPVNLKERMPTIVIRQGTILFEDRGLSATTPVVEIKDVSLILINDPLPTLNIELTGQTDVAGRLQMSLKFDRATGATTGTIDLPGASVSDTLLQRVAALAPDVGNHLRYLKADATMHAAIDYDSGALPPLRYDLTCELSNGRVTHARLPLPLEAAAATIRVVNGQIPFAHLTGHLGAANVEMTLKDLTPPADGVVAGDWLPLENMLREFDLRVEHLQLTDALHKEAPAVVQNLEGPFQPRGPLTLHHSVRAEPDGRWRKTWHLLAEGVQANYVRFPYPVERITGSIDAELTSEHQLETKVNLQGFSGSVPVRLRGTVAGPAQAPAFDLELCADNIPLDEKLLKALPESSQKLALQFLPDHSRQPAPLFRPMGLGDFKAFLVCAPGQQNFRNRFVINIHDACVKYDVFPYPLENVSATLEILPDHWECRNCRGTHKGGEIVVSAQSYLLAERPQTLPNEAGQVERRQRVQVFIHGQQILLDDEDFLAALAPRTALQQTWKKLAIAGRMNFDAVVVDQPDQPQNIDVGVKVQGCRICPHFFPYPLEEVSGSIRYLQDTVYLTDVCARHGNSLLSLELGRVLLKPGAAGFQQVRLKGVKGSPVVADAAFLKALPEPLQNGLAALNLHDPVEVTTDLVIAQPADPNTPLIVWWDGHADLKKATLHAGVEVTDVTGQLSCCGLHNGKQLDKVVGTFLLDEATVLGQPLRDLHGRAEVLPDSPGILRFRDLCGGLYGGTVGGEARVEFGPVPRWELYLKALQVELAQFGERNLGTSADIQGPAMAALHLTGEGGDTAALKGQGRLDVPKGKLYKLPPLLELVKAIGLRPLDRIAFEQAHCVFEIEGPQLHIQQLDLYGNAVSLRGQGRVNLDGSDLNLDVNADWARLTQLLGEDAKKIPEMISDQLLKIKMRGRIGAVTYEKEFVPGLLEPLKKVIRAGGP